jgi:hypothetical protein
MACIKALGPGRNASKIILCDNTILYFQFVKEYLMPFEDS